MTANLASVASIGQTFVNLLITPFLLQVAGTWAALLVTPAAYVLGEFGIMSDQTARMVFICRSMDLIIDDHLPLHRLGQHEADPL